MDRKGGTVFLLLVCCAVLAASVKIKSNSKIRDAARQQMKKCKQMGLKPDVKELLAVMGSDVPVERDPDSSTTTLLSTFADVWESVSFDSSSSKLLRSDGKPVQKSLDGPRHFNSTIFAKMIQKMKKVSEASRCFLGAMMAQMSWDAIISGEDKDMDSEEFESYVWAAEQAIEVHTELPKNISTENLKTLMKMQIKKYPSMSKEQRNKVVKPVKEKMLSDCRAKSDSGKCDKWVTGPVIEMLGPFISRLSAADFELVPQEALCEFFKSDQFKLIVDSQLNPSRGKTLLKKIKECSDFRRYLDRLGPLVCYYDPPKSQTLDQSMMLLSKMCQCPRLAKRKKSLRLSITKQNVAGIVQKLGCAARLLSKKQLALLSKDGVTAVLNNTEINFTKRQMRALIKIYLGKSLCRELSKRELNDLRPVAKALPTCILKKMIKGDLSDPDRLQRVSQKIRRSQAVAIVKELLEEKNITELMDKLPENMITAVPLNHLKNTTVTSWDKVTRKKWSLAQALFFAKKMKKELKNWYRNLGSLIQGVTCEMIITTEAKNVQEMSQSIADAPQRLSKVLAKCTAKKLFTALEQKRSNYFKTITAAELSDIPAVLLIHLSPEKIKGLPDSVCLDMMRMTDVRTLPLRSQSRTALMNRALKCLGSDLSKVSSEDVLQLGPLLCGVPRSQLSLLKPEVLNTGLQELASCDFIPKKNREGIVQLVKDTFGDSSTWNEATMEEMGPLLFLDENAKPNLPKRPWLKDIFRFLRKRLQKPIDFLKEQLFKLIISENESESSQAAARRKRAANSNGNGNNKPDNSNSNSNSSNSTVEPTPELIIELGDLNENWTPEQLDNMSKNTFIETVEVLGDVTGYSPQQLDVLREKAVEVWGDAGRMNESVVTDLGCIAQGFTADKLKMMDFSLSSLADIASCGWNYTQISAVWEGAATHNSLSAKSLSTSDMIDLNRFICGLKSNEIQQLNTTAFMDAVASINKVGCSGEVLQDFKNLTVDAFGSPSTWTEEDVSELGTFVVALDAAQLSSLPVSVFPYLSAESIPLIPTANIAALSVAQIEALGPDNAALVTSDQRTGMKEEQLAALERTEGSRTPNGSGGSSRAAEMMGTNTKFLVSCIMVGLVLL